MDPDIKGWYEEEAVGGFESRRGLPSAWASAARTSKLGRAVEDIGDANLPFFLAVRSPELHLQQSGRIGRREVQNPDPRNAPFVVGNSIRDYKALELTLNRRMANGWQLLASYRL